MASCTNVSGEAGAQRVLTASAQFHELTKFSPKKRGSMNFKLKTAAAAMLAAALVASSASASDPAPEAKKHVAAKRAKTPPPPTVAEQIDALRQEFQGKIDSLKNDLADKDAELKKAHKA